MKKILLFIITIFITFNLLSKEDEWKERIMYGEFSTYTYTTNGAPKDSGFNIYTYSIVRDTVLMDQIIAAVNELLDNDSLFNYLEKKYFQFGDNDNGFFITWDNKKNYKYFTINTRYGYCERFCGKKINEKLIQDNFDNDILNKEVLLIDVMLSFHDEPSGGYCTDYMGKRYFFNNIALITPTSKKIKITVPDDYDIRHLYNQFFLNFIYYQGRIYLNPFDDIWYCYI